MGGEFAVKMGWGYWRVVTEYVDEVSQDQEIRLLPIHNPFTVYMDPSSRDGTGADAEWCLISDKMKRSEYERKYPDREPSEWREGGRGDQGPDWETKEEIRIAEYFRFTYEKDTAVKLSNGREMFKSEYEKKVFQLAGITIRQSVPPPVSSCGGTD